MKIQISMIVLCLYLWAADWMRLLILSEMTETEMICIMFFSFSKLMAYFLLNLTVFLFYDFVVFRLKKELIVSTVKMLFFFLLIFHLFFIWTFLIFLCSLIRFSFSVYLKRSFFYLIKFFFLLVIHVLIFELQIFKRCDLIWFELSLIFFSNLKALTIWFFSWFQVWVPYLWQNNKTNK